MDELERRLIETEARSRSNTKRLDELKETTGAVRELATSVKLLAQSMEGMREEQTAQGERLAALERAPGEQWSSMKRTIFTSAVSTISGGILGAVLALFMR